jgi:hypothetical protein
LDFIQRRRVFQRGGIAEFFAKIRATYNTPHHFRVSRFWDVADENDFTRSERFAKLGGDRKSLRRLRRWHLEAASS